MSSDKEVRDCPHTDYSGGTVTYTRIDDDGVVWAICRDCWVGARGES